MRKALVRGVIAIAGILVLAAAVILVVNKAPNSIHSTVVYGNTSEYATLERISAVRPPLAAPNTHAGSADTMEICFICDLQPEG